MKIKFPERFAKELENERFRKAYRKLIKSDKAKEKGKSKH